MFRRVWKAVETKIRKTRVAKTKSKREERGRGKETREERTEKEEKTQKKENDGSEKSSRRMRDWNVEEEIAKSKEEAKKLVFQRFYK